MTTYSYNGNVLRKSNAVKTYTYALAVMDSNLQNVVEVISFSSSYERLESLRERETDKVCKKANALCEDMDNFDENAWKKVTKWVRYWSESEIIELDVENN